jgi:hypothetical protein
MQDDQPHGALILCRAGSSCTYVYTFLASPKMESSSDCGLSSDRSSSNAEPECTESLRRLAGRRSGFRDEGGHGDTYRSSAI